MQLQINNHPYQPRRLNILDLARKNYKEVWDLQLELHKNRFENRIPDTLILVEHNPVITLGKSGQQNNILISEEELQKKGIEVYRVERGGDATFHGPGQLVGYPIFNIKQGFAGIRPFIEKIEEVIIRVLHDFGISAKKYEKTIGVWTNYGKICSIGIAVRSWISFHGFALNVNTELGYFNLIHPCGFSELKITSMAEILKTPVDFQRVKNKIINQFASQFKKETIKYA